MTAAPPGRPPARPLPTALILVLAVAGLAGLSLPVASGGPRAGEAGIDTALPLTDSAAVVTGRGPYADLEITVNQTRDLVNQAVSVTWTGATPTQRGASRFHGHYLQIMQCWGEDDGTVPDNPGPPPEQCVQGASDAVYGGRNSGVFPAGGYALERIISRQDFPNFDPTQGHFDPRTGYVWRPFRAVDGVEIGTHYDPTFSPAVEGGNYWENPYFNSITTNEVAGGRTRANGTGSELFEVATGLESDGLGCGRRSQPVAGGGFRMPRCWLVVVPRADATTENEGTPFGSSFGVFTSPLAPAAWQHRIAIPLEFNPADPACALDDEQRAINGSELLEGAVASWQQQLCATSDRPPYVYGTIGEATARQQILSGTPGGPGMAVTSRPLAPGSVPADALALYAPLSLSGVVVGFTVERNPRPGVDPAEEELRGVRVADLNLTPRLVAKLLTQSYRLQTAIAGRTPYEWAAQNPAHMAQDPDFLQFNPEFELLQVASGKNFGGLVMPSRHSDVALQVWEWILADPEARAWLAGEADPWGMQVNPVYATTDEANSTGVAFGDPVPESFPKSDPHCHQAPAQGPGGTVLPPPLCGTDWLPYTQSLREAARLARIVDDGARTVRDPFAVSSDQVYRRNGPQGLGSRTILALTDSASAQLYGLQVARLSRAGDNGPTRRFVPPDQAGLEAGVAAMAPRSQPAVLEPDPTLAVPGAYPLTALTYGIILPFGLDAAARQDYAAFLDYAATDGQVQGSGPGHLPPGYTPLPLVLRAQTALVAEAVREAQPFVPPDPDPDPDPDPRPDPPVAPPPADPVAAPVVPAGPGPAPGGGGGAPTGGDPPAAAPEGGEPAGGEDEEETTPPRRAGVLTPFLAVAGSRYALPTLATVALLAAAGIVEITKRPRRLPAAAGGGRP